MYHWFSLAVRAGCCADSYLALFYDREQATAGGFSSVDHSSESAFSGVGYVTGRDVAVVAPVANCGDQLGSALDYRRVYAQGME